VVMVTHDPRIAAYADGIVFLKDGKIVDETNLERKGGAQKIAEKIKEMGE
jgi:putative ABC transport system ATP-binding protein